MAARARNILVGYDGSEAARRALDAAADLTGYGSSLAVVSVASRPDDLSSNGSAALDGHVSARRLLGEARGLLHCRHVTARYLEPVGEPAEMLMEIARELDADLIVVGRRDQNPVGRIVLGSVSAKVVHRALCDVLVVS
jgi:nucleotide-binding universal stress UspA family protein